MDRVKKRSIILALISSLGLSLIGFLPATLVAAENDTSISTNEPKINAGAESVLEENLNHQNLNNHAKTEALVSAKPKLPSLVNAASTEISEAALTKEDPATLSAFATPVAPVSKEVPEENQQTEVEVDLHTFGYSKTDWKIILKAGEKLGDKVDFAALESGYKYIEKNHVEKKLRIKNYIDQNGRIYTNAELKNLQPQANLTIKGNDYERYVRYLVTALDREENALKRKSRDLTFHKGNNIYNKELARIDVPLNWQLKQTVTGEKVYVLSEVVDGWLHDRGVDEIPVNYALDYNFLSWDYDNNLPKLSSFSSCNSETGGHCNLSAPILNGVIVKFSNIDQDSTIDYKLPITLKTYDITVKDPQNPAASLKTYEATASKNFKSTSKSAFLPFKLEPNDSNDAIWFERGLIQYAVSGAFLDQPISEQKYYYNQLEFGADPIIPSYTLEISGDGLLNYKTYTYYKEVPVIFDASTGQFKDGGKTLTKKALHTKKLSATIDLAKIETPELANHKFLGWRLQELNNNELVQELAAYDDYLLSSYAPKLNFVAVYAKADPEPQPDPDANKEPTPEENPEPQPNITKPNEIVIDHQYLPGLIKDNAKTEFNNRDHFKSAVVKSSQAKQAPFAVAKTGELAPTKNAVAVSFLIALVAMLSLKFKQLK